MTTTDKLRNRVIDKLLAVSNQDLLKAIDTMLSNSDKKDSDVQLTEYQHLMLTHAIQELESGKVIDQSKMDEEDLKWLDEQ